MKRALALGGTLLALVVLNIVLPRVTNPYYFQVLMLIGINIVLAVSLNLVNGFTGQFSIGHAGFMAVGAYASAMFTLKLGQPLAASWHFLPGPVAEGLVLLMALIAGGLLAAVAGWIVGLPSLRLRRAGGGGGAPHRDEHARPRAVRDPRRRGRGRGPGRGHHALQGAGVRL